MNINIEPSFLTKVLSLMLGLALTLTLLCGIFVPMYYMDKTSNETKIAYINECINIKQGTPIKINNNDFYCMEKK